MKKLMVLLFVMTLVSGVEAQDHRHRLGIGVNYWTTVDDLDFDDVDREGFSYVLSYQNRPFLLGWELAAEWLPDRFGQNAIAPQAHVLLGGGLYAAAGAGWVYRNGSFADDPFFSLRAGFNINVLPGVYLDLAGNYRFNDRTELRKEETRIDTDTVFLGAAVRVSF